MQNRMVEASARWFLPPISTMISLRFDELWIERELTFEEWGGGESEYTGKEISRPAVTAGGRSRVRPIGADHVIDGGHVNAVVCDSDNGSGDG